MDLNVEDASAVSRSMIGGHAGFSMKFVGADETDEIYTKYGARIENPEDFNGTGATGFLNNIWNGFKRRGCFGRQPE